MGAAGTHQIPCTDVSVTSSRLVVVVGAHRERSLLAQGADFGWTSLPQVGVRLFDWVTRC